MEKRKIFFNETTKKMTLRQKFDYIHNHFYYYTMNSWNRLESIANKVKVYALPLTSQQQDKFFEIYGDERLCEDMFLMLNSLIYDFEAENNKEVFFNGRSGGYIVMTDKKSNGCCVDEDLIDCCSYEDLIEYYIEYKGWSFRDSQAEAKRKIEENFEMVVLFDNLCDDLLNELIFILDNAEIEEEEIVKTYKVKNLIL